MRKPVGKRLLPPATVGALPLDSTANKARGAVWRSGWRCAKLTGQVQEVEVLCDEGNNRSTSLPEPCGRSREGTGEASAGVHAGGAIEQRKTHDSEC